jgi:hypothetical protein
LLHRNATADRLSVVDDACRVAMEMSSLLTDMDSWMTSVSAAWKPSSLTADCVTQDRNTFSPDNPAPLFTCPHTYNYPDVWLAYIWNFHCAAQIVLRESLLELAAYLNYPRAHCQRCERLASTDELVAHVGVVDKVSGTIIRSFPSLLGMIFDPSKETPALRKGKMAGKFFALFAMAVVQQAKYTSLQHKATASEVVAYIASVHSLD